jgi:hypothetical protein
MAGQAAAAQGRSGPALRVCMHGLPTWQALALSGAGACCYFTRARTSTKNVDGEIAEKYIYLRS